MLNIKYKSVYFVFLFLAFCSSVSPAYAQITYFSDNFDSTLNKWDVVRNYQYLNTTLPCMNGLTPAEWSLLNGEYGIKINNSYCVTETIPKDEFWNNEWNDYTYELDVRMVSGVDKNIAWRYIDENNWLGIHIISPWAYFQRIIQDFHTNYQQLLDGHTYHFKIVANGRNHDVYYYDLNTPDNVSHMRGHRDDDIYISGRPALQASAGGSYPNNFSEVYFDNVVVSSLETPEPTPTPSPTPTPTPMPTPTPSPTPGIDLPYFSQTDPRWGNTLYDSTTSRISQLGCALTSTAMVLKYYGLAMIPDSNGNLVTLTPLTLNQWLVNNEGFSKNGELLFPKIAALSKELVSSLESNGSNFDFDTLEFNKLRFFSLSLSDFEKIDRYLSHYLHPLIFKEKNNASASGSHFAVATNVIESGREYSISDPAYTAKTSTVFPPDILQKVIYFRPSNSDLSYMQFQTDNNVHMTIQTPVGSVSEIQSATESASIALEEPILNDKNSSQFSGLSMWEFDYKYPITGLYLLSLTQKSDGFVIPWLFFFDVEGGDKTLKKPFFAVRNRPTKLAISYDAINAENTTIERVVDYPTLMADLQALKRLGWLKHKGLHTSLKGIIDACKPFHSYHWKGFEKMWIALIRKVERLPDAYITSEAREVLLYDLDYLLDHYNPPQKKSHHR